MCILLNNEAFALKSDFNLFDPHSYFTVSYNDTICCSILNSENKTFKFLNDLKMSPNHAP